VEELFGAKTHIRPLLVPVGCNSYESREGLIKGRAEPTLPRDQTRHAISVCKLPRCADLGSNRPPHEPTTLLATAKVSAAELDRQAPSQWGPSTTRREVRMVPCKAVRLMLTSKTSLCGA